MEEVIRRTSGPSELQKRNLLSEEVKYKEKLLAAYDCRGEVDAYKQALESEWRLTGQRNALINGELRTTDSEVEAIRAEIQLECLTKVNGDGKPLATNDTARRALLEKELANSAPYQRAVAKHRGVQNQIDGLEADIAYWARCCTAARLAIESKIAMLGVLAK